MTAKITTKPQNTFEQQQVLKNIDNKLVELQGLEIEITTERNLNTRVAEFARRLKEQNQSLLDLERGLKAVGQAGHKDFTDCTECHKRMWTVINKAIDPIASELDKAATLFITNAKKGTQPFHEILQQIENRRTPITTYLDTGATSSDLVAARERLDAYEQELFTKGQSEQPKPIVTAKDQPKPQPKPPAKDEVPPPKPQVTEQLLPGGLEGVQPGVDVEWLLDDALAHAGFAFAPQPQAPSSSTTSPSSTSPALISSSSSSTTTTTTTTTTTSGPIIKPPTVVTPEKQFSATRRNTNPLAGQQICMLFISEFARFLKDPSLMNLDSIIEDGIHIYAKEKNATPEPLHSLNSSVTVFEPTSESYLKLFNGLESVRKAGAYRMIGAVLNFESSSIAIAISLKNNEPLFHVFCPDGGVKKGDPFRKEYSQVNEAAAFLAELHKGMKEAPINGTMLSFVRKQEAFMLGRGTKKNGSDSSSTSSSSPSVVTTTSTTKTTSVVTTTSSASSTTKTTPASLPPTGLPAHWHDEQRLKTIQEKAFTDSPVTVLAAYNELTLLKTKTGKLQTTIGSLVLLHLYYTQKLLQDPNVKKLKYSMADAFKCKNDFDSTPEQRLIAFIHARAEVLLNGLEEAYRTNDLKAAEQYVFSIMDLCKDSRKKPCKEVLHLLEAISTWIESPATHELLGRIAYIADARKSLYQAWGMPK